MAADGSVIIDTKMPEDGLEKGFRRMTAEMDSVADSAQKTGESIKKAFAGSNITRPVEQARAKLESLEAQLEATMAEHKVAIFQDDDKGAERLARKMETIYGQVESAREKLANEVAKAANKQAAEEEKAAQKSEKAARRQMKNATKPLQRVGTRLREIVSGALVFNLISSGLRAMTSYFGDALKSNNQFAASFNRLKGALMTAFQPIYEAVLPAIITLVNWLTVAIEMIGKFFAALSGKSYSQMQKNAKALNKQKDAISGVGGAAEKAKKQLMGFDEINKLNDQESGGGGGGSTAEQMGPIFEEVNDPGITSAMDEILRLVGAVAAALLTWKIASTFMSSLTQAAGLAVAIGGAFLYATSWANAFANGIDWGNLSTLLLGMILLAGGLGLAFGPVAAAIALIVTGLGLAVLGIREWIQTGELSAEACAALVAGIMAIGVAISLLTGSWIPAAVAGVAALLVTLGTQGEAIKTMLNNLGAWLKDVFFRDWTEVFGVLLGGSLNVLVAVIGSVIKDAKDIFIGLIDFLGLLFSGDWAAIWSGIVSIAAGAINGVIAKLNGLIAAVVGAWNAIAAALSFSIELPNGATIGLSLPQYTAPQIPYLAQGAVIPPNAPFMAVLGDQKHGTNIEAPADLIRQIVREEMANGATNEEVAELLRELISVVMGIHVGDDVIGRAAERYNRKTSRVGGY